MTTYAQLVAKVRHQLMGFTAHQESVSELSVSMGAADTTFTVDQATLSDLSRGLVEIGDELILVKSYDEASGVATVMGAAGGRGVDGTTAATHAANSLITSAPAFPRARVKEAINDTIRGLYPSLVVFATTDIVYNATVYEYEMPAAATEVWGVTARLVGPEKLSPRLPRYDFNPHAPTTDFASGKSIQILSPVTPGQTVRVTYAKPPTVLANDADDFETVTGYPSRIDQLVVYGAAVRMLSPLEGARLQLQAVEATERAPLVPVASAAKAVQLMTALYSQRLEEERQRMFLEHPTYTSTAGF